MPFTDQCREVIRLARVADGEYDRLRREAGFDDALVVSVGDPRWATILEAEKPERDALRRFLLSLSLEDIARIETVMYVGRGDTDDFHTMYRHLLGLFDSAQELADNMLGKSPLADYIEAGIRVAEKQALDLDGSLWLGNAAEA